MSDINDSDMDWDPSQNYSDSSDLSGVSEDNSQNGITSFDDDDDDDDDDDEFDHRSLDEELFTQSRPSETVEALELEALGPDEISNELQRQLDAHSPHSLQQSTDTTDLNQNRPQSITSLVIDDDDNEPVQSRRGLRQSRGAPNNGSAPQDSILLSSSPVTVRSNADPVTIDLTEVPDSPPRPRIVAPDTLEPPHDFNPNIIPLPGHPLPSLWRPGSQATWQSGNSRMSNSGNRSSLTAALQSIVDNAQSSGQDWLISMASSLMGNGNGNGNREQDRRRGRSAAQGSSVDRAIDLTGEEPQLSLPRIGELRPSDSRPRMQDVDRRFEPYRNQHFPLPRFPDGWAVRRAGFSFRSDFGADGPEVIFAGANPLNVPSVLSYNYSPTQPAPPEPTVQSDYPEEPNFTQVTGDYDMICAGCNRLLEYDPDATEGLTKGRAKKDRQEHWFWALKACGHVYCHLCYKNRAKKRRQPGKREEKKEDGAYFRRSETGKLVCLVEGCSTDVSTKSAWVGLFL